nr:capsid protein [Porcine picobirnavirus]
MEANMKDNDKSKFIKKESRRNGANGKAAGNKRPPRKRTNTNNCDLDNTNRDNDPNWYFSSADIAKQVSSISFDQFIGVSSDVRGVTATVNGSGKSLSFDTPSIMVLGANPSPGSGNKQTDGINLAMLKLYSQLSAQNAKTTSYAPQDLCMLVLQLGEVISIMEHIRRAFGVAFTYSYRNRTLPREILSAMGFDPDDFLENLADHRIKFNTWVTAINRVPFISNLTYFYKCADIYQKVYTDSTSEMAQIIIMKPYSTWIVNEAYDSNGSGLVTTMLPASFASAGNTWSDWVTIVEQMIESLFSSATYNYIYSDILNFSAKQGVKLFYLDYLLEGYSVVPEYNENFLLQVHNVTITNEPYTPVQSGKEHVLNDVRCDADKNMIAYSPYFKVDAVSAVTLVQTVVDFNNPNPSTEDIIEATRYTSVLSTVVGQDTNTSKTLYRGAFTLPDHYIVRVSVKAGDDVVSTNSSVISYGTATNKTSFASWFRRITSVMSMIDWAPVLLSTNAEDPNDKKLYVHGDMNYYVVLNMGWFSRVNDLVFLSLFELR